MKHSIKYFIILFGFVLTLNGCEEDKFSDYQEYISKQYAYPPLFSEQNNYIVDLYLVNQGVSSNINFSRNHFIPYVYSDKNNEFNWTFDGFLFIEGQTEFGRDLGISAFKSDWDWLIKKQLKTPGVVCQH